jgi:hypothetical protein
VGTSLLRAIQNALPSVTGLLVLTDGRVQVDSDVALDEDQLAVLDETMVEYHRVTP